MKKSNPEPDEMNGAALVIILIMVVFVTWMRMTGPAIEIGNPPTIMDWKLMQQLQRS